ncbi:MAG: hypothetical protein GY928_14775 [Colwellia sp.]|nr:hypothetical protein [Colwellia sp.]
MEKIWLKDGKFTELTADQMKDFDASLHAAYATDKNENFVDTAIKSVEGKMDNMKNGLLSKEDIENIKADFTNALKGLDTEALSKYVETIASLKTEVKDANTLAGEIKEIAKAQGLAIKSMGEKKVPDVRRKASREDHMKALITNAFSTKEFKEFEGRGFKGASNKMYLDQSDGKIEVKDVATKATVDMASHTGVVMISEVSDVVRDDAPTRTSHVRDIINVSMTDQAQIVAGQVYEFTDALTLGAITLAENGEAPESVFKSKENTWTLKRIANSMRISKRELKVNGLQWVIDKVMAKLPDATLFVEDVQLLFGDGAGNNVQGLANDAQAFDLAPNTYAIGDFTSIATYNGATQTLVTFTDVHNLKNGDNLILADTTGTTYDGTHASIEVINTTQVIIDQAYTADANVITAWTGSSTSPFYQGIDNAQEYDVLAVADANLEAGEYAVSGHVIHPSQATQMGLLKDTQGNYLNISKDANGKVTGVNGKPVVTTTAMPYGKFISGDFTRNGLELKEFTPLNIQFVEDVESVKKNEIVVVIEEEIIFPIYNPYWFTFGKFSTAKTQLETP